MNRTAADPAAAMTSSNSGESLYDVELIEAIRSFLEQPESARRDHRLGKSKLHSVYRFEHGRWKVIVKVKGEETTAVRWRNWWKGIRHFAVTGEQTRLGVSVDQRWKHELMTAVGWKQVGLPTVTFIPYPDEDVRVMLDAGMGTLSEHLRDAETDRKFKLFSLMEVAGILFARHTMIAAAGNALLFHEEPHTSNLLYRPGELVYIDQEFLPDLDKPDIHHAASELIALTQSAIRDLGYEDPQEVVDAIAHGYPDPQTLETVMLLLQVRRPRFRWLFPARSPVSTEQLAQMFARHTKPEERMRPTDRPTPLGMPGDLTQRPESNELG